MSLREARLPSLRDKIEGLSNENLVEEIRKLKQEISTLKKVEPKPLKKKDAKK